MMAWILVSLLAGYASSAVVDISPETTIVPMEFADGNDNPPPKP